MLNFFIPTHSTFSTLLALLRGWAARALHYHTRRVSPGRGSWPVDLAAG